MKYDSIGNTIWGKSTTGSGSIFSIYGNVGTSLSVDGIGNLYVAGYFEDTTIVFGSYILTNSKPQSSSTDIFLVKYSNSGNEIWARSIGAIDCNTPYFGINVKVDFWGSVYLSVSSPIFRASQN